MCNKILIKKLQLDSKKAAELLKTWRAIIIVGITGIAFSVENIKCSLNIEIAIFSVTRTSYTIFTVVITSIYIKQLKMFNHSSFVNALVATSPPNQLPLSFENPPDYFTATSTNNEIVVAMSQQKQDEINNLIN